MNNKDIIIQIIDCDYYHEYDDKDEINKYVVRIYGTTKDDKKVIVKVEDFKPYFFVEIPINWKKEHIIIFIDKLKDKVSNENKKSIKRYEIVERNKFWGFTDYKIYKFLKIEFHNYDAFRAYEYALNRDIFCISLWRTPRRYQVFESNIEPILRLMHIKQINLCGWIKIQSGKYNYLDNMSVHEDDINVSIKWNNLEPINDDAIIPLRIASFDIECKSDDGSFPQPERDGDSIIQIGTTFSRYGEDDCYYKHIITLGSCDKIEGVVVESYNDEKDVLLAWTNLIKRMNPDIITGYNIFGFDYKYMEARSKKLGINSKFTQLGRIKDEQSKFVIKNLSSSALGENILHYYAMQGRVQIDLLKVIQRDFKLPSYKLDNVISEFIRGQINDIQMTNTTKIITKGTYGLTIGRYIKIFYNDGLSDSSYKDGKKFKVIGLGKEYIEIKEKLDGDILDKKNKVYWCQAKDDLKPYELFEKQKGSSNDRKIIAEYCIQDCVLCNILVAKLQILTNNIGMANVCHVPLSYIFLRGQGIKIFSLVSKKCSEKNHLIPVLRKKNTEKKDDEEDNGYEGATVLEPNKGFHDEPIPVLDYASLYPRSMIYKNISHECIVLDDKYNNLEKYIYETVTYNNNNGTTTTCIFAKAKDGSKGILPEILTELLDARENTRDKIKTTKDVFMQKILDGLQLAYKLTANSLYGQTGAETSPIYMKSVAASTTATGRIMLESAKKFAERVFPIIVKQICDEKYTEYEKLINELFDTNSCNGIDMFPTHPVNEKEFIDKKNNVKNREEFIEWYYEKINKLLEGKYIEPHCIYGDTDSIFINMGIKDKKTKTKTNDLNNVLNIAINLGILCGKLINLILPNPTNLEYEKTFYPFILLTKKRYVGNMYTFTPDNYYQKSMGIVLKRRDNAPIVKILVGGIVDKMLNDKNNKLSAVNFTREELKKILSGKYQIDKFIVSKTLKNEYANRDSIVHAVLADRMAKRDPGNKPQSSDRIPYVYIQIDKKVKLQGDRVEHPEYILEHNIKIDYLFYITNQIMKPAIQFLELLIEKPQEIFDDYINRELNRRKGQKPISYYIEKNNDTTNDTTNEIDNIYNYKLNNSDNEIDSDNDTNSELELEIINKEEIKPKMIKQNITDLINNTKDTTTSNISINNEYKNVKQFTKSKKIIKKTNKISLNKNIHNDIKKDPKTGLFKLPD